MRSPPALLTQRCWIHKAADICDTVLISDQPAMKVDLREIHGKAAAEMAMPVFIETCGAK